MVRRGSAAFDAWLRYWRRHQPLLAEAAEVALAAPVPSRWPPGFAPPRKTRPPTQLHQTNQAAGERREE